MRRSGSRVYAAGVLSLLGVAQGCAHSAVERRVDEKLAQEAVPSSRAELRDVAGQRIENVPSLSGEQRSRLLTLRSSHQAQTEGIREQSLKLRSLLIKEVISSTYDQDEVGYPNSANVMREFFERPGGGYRD